MTSLTPKFPVFCLFHLYPLPGLQSVERLWAFRAGDKEYSESVPLIQQHTGPQLHIYFTLCSPSMQIFKSSFRKKIICLLSENLLKDISHVWPSHFFKAVFRWGPSSLVKAKIPKSIYIYMF